MDQHEIVPDVLDSIPPAVLHVTYASDVQVNLGNELTPTAVKDMPSVSWQAEERSFYTLVMVDPDAPSRREPLYREILHWLVVNIPGTQVSDGETLATYWGSGPPQDSGLHRYAFFVYKQPRQLPFNDHRLAFKTREKRIRFSLRSFAEKLELGQPIAFNLYQAQWDEYVPILRSALEQKAAILL